MTTVFLSSDAVFSVIKPVLRIALFFFLLINSLYTVSSSTKSVFASPLQYNSFTTPFAPDSMDRLRSAKTFAGTGTIEPSRLERLQFTWGVSSRSGLNSQEQTPKGKQSPIPDMISQDPSIMNFHSVVFATQDDRVMVAQFPSLLLVNKAIRSSTGSAKEEA